MVINTDKNVIKKTLHYINFTLIHIFVQKGIWLSNTINLNTRQKLDQKSV